MQIISLALRALQIQTDHSSDGGQSSMTVIAVLCALAFLCMAMRCCCHGRAMRAERRGEQQRLLGSPRTAASAPSVPVSPTALRY